MWITHVQARDVTLMMMEQMGKQSRAIHAKLRARETRATRVCPWTWIASMSTMNGNSRRNDLSQHSRWFTFQIDIFNTKKVKAFSRWVVRWFRHWSDSWSWIKTKSPLEAQRKIYILIINVNVIRSFSLRSLMLNHWGSFDYVTGIRT